MDGDRRPLHWRTHLQAAPHQCFCISSSTSTRKSLLLKSRVYWLKKSVVMPIPVSKICVHSAPSITWRWCCLVTPWIMAGNGRKSNFSFKSAVKSEKLSIQDTSLFLPTMYLYICSPHTKKKKSPYIYVYMNLKTEGVEFHAASNFKDFLQEY